MHGTGAPMASRHASQGCTLGKGRGLEAPSVLPLVHRLQQRAVLVQQLVLAVPLGRRRLLALPLAQVCAVGAALQVGAQVRALLLAALGGLRGGAGGGRGRGAERAVRGREAKGRGRRAAGGGGASGGGGGAQVCDI